MWLPSVKFDLNRLKGQHENSGKQMMMDRQAKERHQTLQLNFTCYHQSCTGHGETAIWRRQGQGVCQSGPCIWSEQPKSAITEVEVADNDWNQLIYIN